MSETPDTAAPDAVAASARPALDDAFLFELAWEVCAQVGGIYTVLRSKAPFMTRCWADRYMLIGPYRQAAADLELEPHRAPQPLSEVIEACQHAGMKLHFGRWLIPGRPQALLVDLASVRPRIAEAKYSLWKDNGVASPVGDVEFDEIALFGHVAAELLERFRERLTGRTVLAHFHEWQGGAALPMLRHRGTKIGTIFTTHATLVGRSLSSASVELYANLRGINGSAVANQHGFGHRHALEGAAAAAADVFTTVSDITNEEAEQFLGRRADLLLPNGLNIERFAAPHEFQVLHRSAKERIHEFVMGHFFPSYTFDLDRTLYVFTAGRYEYRNKGLDVYIEALHELNQRMKAEQADATVVAFIITRAGYRNVNVDALDRRAMLNEMQKVCAAIKDQMGQRLLQTVAAGRVPTIHDLLTENDSVRIRRILHAWRRPGLPAIVTHDLCDDGGDAVLRHLRHRGLFNQRDDRVKVVFHADFVTATSPLIGMDYDDFVRGCHLGVFPSYYEPWGYTPLECMVRGVPAITSDLSGFGAYLMENVPDHDDDGMYVARRRRVEFTHTVNEVAGWMHGLTRMSQRERIGLRNRVEARCDRFDWEYLGRHYLEAYGMALARRGASASGR